MPWKAQYMDEQYGPFVVDDGTGTAYVDPEDAEFELNSDDEFTVDAGEEPPARVREFLERERDLAPVDSGRRRRYTEVRIGVGDSVLVAGQTDPDAASDIDRPVTTAITERGDAPRFYVTDDPDSGVGSSLVRGAFVRLLVAAVLLGVAYVLLFV